MNGRQHIIGLGIGDFVPFVGAAGKIAGGLLSSGSPASKPSAAGGVSGGTDDASKAITSMMSMQILQSEADRKAKLAAQDRADAQASTRNKVLALGGIGVAILGLAYFVFKK